MNQSPSHSPSRFDSALQSRSLRIGIIGLGYVGLPLSLVFVNAGFQVTGFDVDPSKISKLKAGHSYIKHIGAETVVRAVTQHRLVPTSNFDLLAEMDAILICVPTPLNHKQEPDLGFIESSAREIANRLRPDQLIVLESSTYPGTTDEVVVPILETCGIKCRASQEEGVAQAAAAASSSTSAISRPANTARAYVAFSPEREDPGNKQFTTRHIPKLVGGIDDEAGRRALQLYSAAFEKVIPVSHARVAEMAKILENTYRCVNIALVNELKQLCLRMNIDICEVIDAAATKPFGFQPFYPGPGLGGHCIPIDPFYLSWKAKDYDFVTRFIHLAGEINSEMPYKAVESIAEALNVRRKAVNGAKILILGVAYKKDIDDLRESPALKIIELLTTRGAHVQYHDPFCPHVWKGRQNDYEMDSISFVPEDAANYDAVVITTDHSALDYPAILRHSKLLIDTRNATKGLRAPNLVRC